MVAEIINRRVAQDLSQVITNEVQSGLRALGASDDTVSGVSKRLKIALSNRFKLLAFSCDAEQSKPETVQQSIAGTTKEAVPVDARADPESNDTSHPYSIARHLQSERLNKTIYVGNLAATVDEGLLRQKFMDCGDVVKCTVIRHRWSGDSKVFGFVEFAAVDSAKYALETHGSFMMEGREVYTKWHTAARKTHERTKIGIPKSFSEPPAEPEMSPAQASGWWRVGKAGKVIQDSDAGVSSSSTQSSAPESSPSSLVTKPNALEAQGVSISSTPIVDLLHGTRKPIQAGENWQRHAAANRIVQSILPRTPKQGFHTKFINAAGELTNIGNNRIGLIKLINDAVIAMDKSNIDRVRNNQKPEEAAEAIEKALQTFVGVNRRQFPELMDCGFMKAFSQGTADSRAVSDSEYKLAKRLRLELRRDLKVGRNQWGESPRYGVDGRVSAELTDLITWDN